MIRVLDGRNFNFTLIENDIIDDIERFDKNDLLCYMVLCRFANNSTGECYPSYKTIAEKMRVVVSTEIKAIKSLESKGVILISSRNVLNTFHGTELNRCLLNRKMKYILTSHSLLNLT